MKRFILNLLVLLILPGFVYAQKGSSCPDDLVPKFEKRRKQWGYSDLFGQWIIEPVYTKVSPFVENKAVVQKGNLLGVIDCDGNVVLLPKYEQLTNFRFGKIWAMQEGKWGLLDQKGKLLLNHEYAEIFPIEMTELAWVRKGNMWGLINESNGRWLTTPQYTIAQVMSENCSLVQTAEEKFGVINHVNGGFLLQADITSVKKIDSRTILYQSKNKWGIFSNEGRIKANAEYDTIYQATPQLLVIQKAGNFGLSTPEGKVMLEPAYDQIGEYNDGAFLLKKNGRYGYANVFGKVQIEPQFEAAEDFKNRMAIIRQEGKYGVINLRKEYILKAQYSRIRNAVNFPVLIVHAPSEGGKEKQFLYNERGAKITETGFDEVYAESKGNYLRVKENGKIRFFSVKDGSFPVAGQFDDARDFVDGYAQVSQEGKWGMIKESGEFIVPAQFEQVEAEQFGTRTVFLTRKGGLGLYDDQGKQVLKNEFEELTYCYPNLIKARKNGKYGVLKSDGTVLVDFIYETMSKAGEYNGNPEWPSIIQENGKYGLLDDRLNVMYKPSALAIFYSGDNYFAVKEKKDWGLLNDKATNEFEAEFDTISVFGNNLVAVKKGKKWGYLDKNLSIKIPFSFEEAYPFSEYCAIVKKSGRYGIIDIRGEFIVPAEYDEMDLRAGSRILIKDGKMYQVQEKGNLQHINGR